MKAFCYRCGVKTDAPIVVYEDSPTGSGWARRFCPACAKAPLEPGWLPPGVVEILAHRAQREWQAP